MLLGRPVIDLVMGLTVNNKRRFGAYFKGVAFLDVGNLEKPRLFKSTIVHEMIGHPLEEAHGSKYHASIKKGWLEHGEALHDKMSAAWGNATAAWNIMTRSHGPEGYLEEWLLYHTIVKGNH